MERPRPDLDQLVDLARRLSPLEKLLLIQRLTPDLETALRQTADSPPHPRRRSLRGMIEGCSIGAEDIEQARREMWSAFHREKL